MVQEVTPESSGSIPVNDSVILKGDFGRLEGARIRGDLSISSRGKDLLIEPCQLSVKLSEHLEVLIDSASIR